MATLQGAIIDAATIQQIDAKVHALDRFGKFKRRAKGETSASLIGTVNIGLCS